MDSCPFECCHIRIVSLNRSTEPPDTITVGFETVCLKNNSVRYDEGTAEVVDGDIQASIAVAWQGIAPLITEWNKTITPPSDDPVACVVGKKFNPTSLSLE